MKTLIIAKNEFRNFFNSVAAYVVLVVFLLITGWFFATPLFLIGQAELRSLFTTIPWIFLLFIPAITMGTISKEKTTGTLESLATLPVSDGQIILGKFWASLGLVAVGVAFTFIHLITITILGTNVDFGAILCGYFGLLLIGAAYSAIGIFASTLTANQIVSFIVSFLIIFFFVIIEFVLIFIPAPFTEIFQYLSIGYHFENIARGVIDTRNIIYFLTMTFFFLRLSTILMDSRKWK